MPLVSVVMPVYNAAPYLRDCMDSILRQSYRDFEFIIVNDGSTDSSLNILERYKVKDKRIKLFSFEKNEGSYIRLNYGIEKAKSNYIMRQDADDISLPNRMAKQLNYLAKHSDVSCVGTHIICISDSHAENVSQLTKGIEVWHNSVNSPEEHFKLRFMQCPMLHGTAMFTKQIFADVGGYDTRYFTGADYDFLHKLLHNGSIAKLPEKLYVYRLVGNSLYHRNLQTNLKNTFLIRLRWIEYERSQVGLPFKSVLLICEESSEDILCEAVREAGIDIAGLVKVNSSIPATSDIPVYDLENLDRAWKKADLILIKHFNYSQIRNTLNAMGLVDMKDYIVI